MGKVSLRVKLIGSYLCLAAIILVVALVGGTATSSTEKSMVQLGTVDFPKVNTLENIIATMTVFQRIERTLLVRNYFMDEDERANQFNILRDNWKTAEQLMKGFEALPLTADESAKWQEVKTNWQTWRKAHEHIIELVKNVDLKDEEQMVKIEV